MNAVKSLRMASRVQPHTLGSANKPTPGSLACAFTQQHPTPGKGVVFSPDGKYLALYGSSPEVKLLRTLDGTIAASLKQPVEAWANSGRVTDGDDMDKKTVSRLVGWDGMLRRMPGVARGVWQQGATHCVVPKHCVLYGA